MLIEIGLRNLASSYSDDASSKYTFCG